MRPPADVSLLPSKDGSIPAAVMNYVTPETGVMSSRRDKKGSDDSVLGVNWNDMDVTIRNGRTENLSLNVNGFELMPAPRSNAVIDFFDQDDVVERYYPACEELVAKAVARNGNGEKFSVRAFDHNVRSTWGDERRLVNSTGGAIQQPIAVVHGDYTRISAPQRVLDLADSPKANDVFRGRLGSEDASLLDPTVAKEAVDGERRFALINVWRNIREEDPVRQYPLACIDAATTRFGDMRTFQIHYADRIGENYFACHQQRHKWYYFPDMLFDEAMLIKQWDSLGGIGQGLDSDEGGHLCTFSLHSSLLDCAVEENERESIEVRCVVIWDS